MSNYDQEIERRYHPENFLEDDEEGEKEKVVLMMEGEPEE